MIHASAPTQSHSHAPRLQPDPARILTLSGTFALNLLVFGLLLVPVALPPQAVLTPSRPNMVMTTVVSSRESARPQHRSLPGAAALPVGACVTAVMTRLRFQCFSSERRKWPLAFRAAPNSWSCPG